MSGVARLVRRGAEIARVTGRAPVWLETLQRAAPPLQFAQAATRRRPGPLRYAEDRHRRAARTSDLHRPRSLVDYDIGAAGADDAAALDPALPLGALASAGCSEAAAEAYFAAAAAEDARRSELLEAAERAANAEATLIGDTLAPSELIERLILEEKAVLEQTLADASPRGD